MTNYLDFVDDVSHILIYIYVECVIASGWLNMCSEPSLEGYMNTILPVEPSGLVIHSKSFMT
jgi:hypothetical protein